MTLIKYCYKYIYYFRELTSSSTIDNSLLNMIVTDLQPVSIVEDKGFLEFVRVLDHKYCLPSRRTIMRDHLSQLYKSKQQQLMEELNGINDCCLTTDMWTSRATEMYITMTCHYIDKKNMELKSAVLNT